MKARFVRESLYTDLYYENQLFESVLNENFSVNKIVEIIPNIKDKKQAFKNLVSKFNKENNFNFKKAIGITLIAFYLVGFTTKNNKWASQNILQIEKAGVELTQVAKEIGEISVDDIATVAEFKAEKPEIVSTPIIKIHSDIINDINKVVPKRMSPEKINQYEQYNKSILKAVENLKAKGEKANADLIKSIMLIETGMKPRKNSLGFEGFPQTKQHIINGINKKYKTSFTMEDMYNAERSAEFIHYYTKSLQKSQYVNNLEDMIIAYNWGMGNLGAYKRGEKQLPNQSKDYVKMIKVLEKYFS